MCNRGPVRDPILIISQTKRSFQDASMALGERDHSQLPADSYFRNRRVEWALFVQAASSSCLYRRPIALAKICIYI